MKHSITIYYIILYKLICSLMIGLLIHINLFSQYPHQREFLDSLNSILESDHTPGAFITVVRHDSVLLHHHYGLANIQDGEVVTEEHLFRIGSITKTFIAIAILQLIEQNQLHLDDRLVDITPEIPFRNKWHDTNPVQIKDLLEHKAGFDEMHYNSLSAQRTMDMDALSEVLFHKTCLTSRWKPGLVHSYSNPGYVMLGYIIEKKTGSPYQTYIKDCVLKPMGLNHASFISQIAEKSVLQCRGYNYDNHEFSLARQTKLIGEAAGALQSNSTDAISFLQFLLGGNRAQLPISLNSIKEMEQVHGWFEIENGIKEGYGLGIYSRRFGTHEVQFKGHNGGINGFISDYIYNRDLNIGILIANNGENSNDQILDYLVDHYLPDAEATNYPMQTIDIDPNEWNGDYQLVNLRNQVMFLLVYPFASIGLQVAHDSINLKVFLSDEQTFYPAGGNAYIKKAAKHPNLFLSEINGQKCIYYNEDVLIPMNTGQMLFWRTILGLSICMSLILLVLAIVQGAISFFKPAWKQATIDTLIVGVPIWLFIISMIPITTASSLDQLTLLGELSIRSMIIFFATSLFPVSAIFLSYYISRNWTRFRYKLQAYLYALMTGASLCIVYYCWYFEWIFKMIWKY